MFSAKSKNINVNVKNDNTIANLLTPADLINGRLAKVDLTQLKTNIVPSSSDFQIGTSDHPVNFIYTNDISLVGNIIPTGDLVSNLGSPNNWFGNIYVNHAIIGPKSIQLGNALITSFEDTISLPIGSTVGGINPGTIVIKGAFSVPESLPSTNSVGDGFIIGTNLWVSTLTNSVYGVAGWTNVGPFVGPQGPQGVNGPAGADGPAGSIGPTGPAGPAGPVGTFDLSGSVEMTNLIITNKSAIGRRTTSSYTLDVSGSLNSATIYENGTSLSSKYAPIGVTEQIADLLTKNLGRTAFKRLRDMAVIQTRRVSDN
jgi:hypothetical protein